MNQRQWLQTKDNLKQNDKTHMGAEVNKMTLSGYLTKQQPSLSFSLGSRPKLSLSRKYKTPQRNINCFSSLNREEKKTKQLAPLSFLPAVLLFFFKFC